MTYYSFHFDLKLNHSLLCQSHGGYRHSILQESNIEDRKAI